MRKKNVPSIVKDQQLVKYRRNQIIQSAVKLFIQKGFHRTTTREISKLSGFSIGTLYEYIGSKEDVLYLVCDAVYDEVIHRLHTYLNTELEGIERLKLAVESYFRVVDQMQDEVLVMYQEAKSLQKEALQYVLEKEMLITQSIEQVIRHCVDSHLLTLDEKQIKLFSHNILVNGHMWAFRRWALKKSYTIDEYIELQIEQLLNGLKGQAMSTMLY
ncbi:TetR/AcrR family transcriptional regulator [Anaerobacillus sp. MEB173]|uniref:TetR/AcrR family transcriptional regulator n=1 Tax=Anaerobacillus sp. MEB173 TaxID=3383345 RepID=UPI003F92AEC9